MIGQKRLDTNYKFDFTQWQIDQDKKITDLYSKINSGGGGTITIDDKLSNTSTHAVQNKVIAIELENINDSVSKLTEKDDKLKEDSINAVQNSTLYAKFKDVDDNITAIQSVIDNTETAVKENSTNLVTSGAVYSALADANITINIDDKLIDDSANAVQNSVITANFNTVNTSITALQELNPNEIVINGLDNEPTLDSANLVTSGGVYASIEHFTTDFNERLDTAIPDINSRLTANTDSINALYSLVNSISAGGGNTVITTIFDNSKYEDYYNSIYFWSDYWDENYYDLETVIDPSGKNVPSFCNSQYDYTLRLSYDLYWNANLEVVFSELLTIDTSTILETLYYCNANGQDITVELVDNLKDKNATVIATFDTIKSFYLDDGEVLRVLYNITNISDTATNGKVQGYLRYTLKLGGSNYQFTRINIINVENNEEE